MKLSNLSKKTLKTSMLYDGDTLNYEFRHELITPRLVADIDAITTSDQLLALSQHVVDLVVTWDLVEYVNLDPSSDVETEVPFPLDVTRLQTEIPLMFQATLIKDMIMKMRTGSGESAPAESLTVSPSPVGSFSAA